MEMDTLRKVKTKEGVKMVYYNHKRRRTGDVFQLIDREKGDGTVILAEDQFSKKTMEWVSDDTPLTLSIGSTARTGEKIIDQEDIVEANVRRATALSEVKKVKVTRPGRKEEKAPAKKKATKAKAKKDLNPNKTQKSA